MSIHTHNSPNFLYPNELWHIMMISAMTLYIMIGQELWQEEIRQNFQRIKARGSHLPKLEEEFIHRRKEELR